MAFKFVFARRQPKRMRSDLVHPKALHANAVQEKKQSKTTRIVFHIRKAFSRQKHADISAAQSANRLEYGHSLAEADDYCSEEFEQDIDSVTAPIVTTQIAPTTTPTTTTIVVEYPSDVVTLEIRPTTPDTVSQNADSFIPITRQIHDASIQSESVDITTEYVAAAEVLSQRHAAMVVQPSAALQLSPTGVSVTTSARHRSASLPARMSALVSSQQPQTSDEACKGYQRLQLIKHVAYRAAVDGCEGAVGFIDQLNAHSNLKARYPDVPNLTLSFDGVYVDASQLRDVEWKWISRFNAAREIAHRAECRLLGSEDCEIICTQLFPADAYHLYKPEHFEIFITGLGEEGILSKQQAKRIAVLGVTAEEFDGGAHYTGPSCPRYTMRNDPSAIALFQMPLQPCRSVGTDSNRITGYLEKDLYYYLRILAEAAVYDQSFWKGYFIPNACSLIRDFHEAYVVSEDGWSLPPNLVDFKRHWNYREIRLLQRAYIIGRMLDMWDSGHITDFGIIRAVRGTFLHLPMHSFWAAEELESFLYSRVAGSGLPVDKIPEILALHPDNDSVFAHSHSRNTILRALIYRSQEFEEEEEHRLSQIELSQTSFEIAMKAQMSTWQRVKAKLRKSCGMERKLAPFDPFSPEHDTQGAI